MLTRREVAALLGVSLSTVDRMASNGQIKRIKLGEKLVRFRRSEVFEALRNGERKFGRKAALPVGEGSPKSEIRNPN